MVSVSMRSISASTTRSWGQSNGPDPGWTECTTSNPHGTLLHVYDKNHPGVPQFLEELRAVMDEYEDRVTLGEIGASRDVSQALMGEYTAPGRLNSATPLTFSTVL